MTEKPERPIFAVDFPDGQTLDFLTLEEFDAWVRNERIYWEWLAKERIPDGYHQNVWNRYQAKLNRLDGFVRNAIQNNAQKNATALQTALENLRNELLNETPNVRIVYSFQFAAKYVTEELRPKNLALAIHTLAHLAGDFAPNLDSKISLWGMQEAYHFEHGFKDRSTSERRALGKLRAEWQESLNSQKTIQNRLENEFHRTRTSKAIFVFDDMGFTSEKSLDVASLDGKLLYTHKTAFTVQFQSMSTVSPGTPDANGMHVEWCTS